MQVICCEILNGKECVSDIYVIYLPGNLFSFKKWCSVWPNLVAGLILHFPHIIYLFIALNASAMLLEFLCVCSARNMYLETFQQQPINNQRRD